MYAQDCLSGPANLWLPLVFDIRPLYRDGYVVFMERLWPVQKEKALELCAALSVVSESVRRDALSSVATDDFEAVRGRLRKLHSEGSRRYKLWGEPDLKPDNVMRTIGGQLKILDPFYVSGKAIIEALRDGRRDLLSDFTQDQLEDFMTIPGFKPGAGSDQIRAWFSALYARTSGRRGSNSD